MGDSRFARCLQGAGVRVSSGTVTITSCSIYGNTAGYVCAHVQKVPFAPMGFSHVLRFVLAGWWSLHQQWHGDLVIVHHHWQFCVRSACSRSKFPIAPMGDSRVACCLQGGGVYVSSGTVTITSSSITGNTASGDVRAHVQNFPSPRWESC